MDTKRERERREERGRRRRKGEEREKKWREGWMKVEEEGVGTCNTNKDNGGSNNT